MLRFTVGFTAGAVAIGVAVGLSGLIGVVLSGAFEFFAPIIFNLISFAE